MPWSVRLDLADPLAYGFGCAADLRRPLRSVLSFVLQYHLQAALEDPGRSNQYRVCGSVVEVHAALRETRGSASSPLGRSPKRGQ